MRRQPASLIKMDVVSEVSKAAEIARVKAEEAVDVILDELKACMARGGRMEIRGFGVFIVKPRKGGIGRNPKTGQVVPIPPGRTVRFKPGQALENIGHEVSQNTSTATRLGSV